MLLPNDEDMVLGLRSPQNVNNEMVEKINEYLKRRKCAFWAKLVSITIYNVHTYQPLEAEHFCVIIKPTQKYAHDKDSYNIFEIIKPYIADTEGDFLDFSIIGFFNTMQIDDQGKGLIIYE
jgi:hypothetical protein